jgi:hypothetical protein
MGGGAAACDFIAVDTMKTLVDPMRTRWVTRQILNAIVVKVAEIRHRHHRPLLRTQTSTQSERSTCTVKDEVAEPFLMVASNPNDSGLGCQFA